MPDTIDTSIESLEAIGESASGRAQVGGFIVVSIQANTRNRYVEAVFEMNGQNIGKLTAADNHMDGVISTGAQITTIPVPPGTNWKVSWNVPNNNGEVRLWLIKH